MDQAALKKLPKGWKSIPSDLNSDQTAFKGVQWGKAMMWIFLLSDTFIFSCFLLSYMKGRGSTVEPWPNPSEVFGLHVGQANVPLLLIAIMTFILITSSGTMALAVNMALIIGALSILQATLTLPGIAGIVLTIGMAVDANVLIFERIREEVRNGRSPFSSVDIGFRQAFRTIVDANVTTLIAAVLLFQFGSGPVKGFSVTLAIGIATSMFTAIMFTRMLIVLWLHRFRPQTIPI